DVVAAIADSSAVFSVNGYGVKSGEAISQPLDVGENMMRTRVFAQSGAYTDYIITVTRAKSPDATLADIGINTPGTIDKPFNNDSLNYEYHVASTENVFRIKPVTNNNGATIRINGDAVDPNLGYSYSFLRFTVREPIVVVITSQDSSSVKMFTINAVRDFSSNAYMANLQLFGDIPLTPAFDKNIYNYTATISDSTRSSTFIIQESEDKNAEVRINYVPQTWKSYAAVPLNSGENVFSISVRAQDGTQNLYTLRVARALGATASLSGLVLSGNNGNYSNVINVYADTVYSVKAPNSVATLYVNAYANDTGAEVKINGNLFNEQTSPAVSLNLGDNRFDIEIKSADGSAIRKYTLHVNRVPFADVTLASLKVSKGIISPLFSPATSTYTVPMGSSDTTITVTPVAVDPTATITVGINTISNANPSASQHLNSGNNTVNIRVTAADGITTKLYSVRPNVPSAANANLYNILLSKGSVSPVFTAANTTYSAAVSYATSTIDIHPLSLEKAAIIKVNGNTLDSTHIAAGQNLIVGDNIFTIIVKASDVSSVIKTYTLTINRAAP
ncbi:MAG: cadherin-like beta sandwich domain-containing protein, partial [Sphingobacteriales bacterium]